MVNHKYRERAPRERIKWIPHQFKPDCYTTTLFDGTVYANVELSGDKWVASVVISSCTDSKIDAKIVAEKLSLCVPDLIAKVKASINFQIS